MRHSLAALVAVSAATLVCVLTACSSSGSSAPAGASGATEGSTSTSTASATGATFKTVKAGCLTVAYLSGSMPRIDSGANGQLTGYEGYLLDQVAAQAGLKICPYPTDFASSVLAVSSGRADVDTSLYYTAARAKSVQYTRSLVNDDLVFVYPSSVNYTSPASLKGKKFAAVTSWTYAPAMEQYFGKSNITFAPGTSQILQLLKNGQVAGSIFGAAGPAATLAKSDPKFAVTALKVGDLGMNSSAIINPVHQIVNCKNPELGTAIDNEITSLVKSGEWKKQLDSYGVSAAGVLPPADEQPPASC